MRDSRADAGRSRSSTSAMLAALVLPAVVPWSVQFIGPRVFLVFPWGLVHPGSLSATTLPEYLLLRTMGLPEWIWAWPIGVGLYLLALASATAGVVAGREDVRVTAGLLALAGATQLTVAWGFSYQPGRIAVPLGTAALWVVAWYRYTADRGHPDAGP